MAPITYGTVTEKNRSRYPLFVICVSPSLSARKTQPSSAVTAIVSTDAPLLKNVISTNWNAPV